MRILKNLIIVLIFILNLNAEAADGLVVSDNAIISRDISVRVVRAVNGQQSIIYTGDLSGYDDGAWADMDFNNIDFSVIFNWENENEIIYIIPTEETGSSILQMQSGFQSAYSNAEAIEYDITYTISENSTELTASYSVSNSGTDTADITLVAVLYDNDKMINMETKSLNIIGGVIGVDNITLSLPEQRDNYSVKLMVWDGLNTLRPVGSSKNISDLDFYQREKSISITSDTGTEFDIYMNMSDAKGGFKSTHKICYNPEKTEPIDLCGLTYEKELTAGNIENTEIKVNQADLVNGIIEYEITLPDGRNTGINNFIKFKALTDLDAEEIIYTID